MSTDKIFQVAFDTAHKPRGKISSNFSELAKLLNSNGFNCSEYEEYPITKKTLRMYDILAIICPDNSKISKDEIDAIKSWVWKEGGGLLLVNHAGGDKGRRSNLNFLGQQFGISFENDQLLDVDNNIGVENLPVVDMFPLPHPINDGIKEICYRAGCTLVSSRGDIMPSISSASSAEPSDCPLVLSGEDGDGMVVAVGSYEMFRDKTNGGIDFEDNSQVALNIFNHLKTAKRASINMEVVMATEAAEQSASASPQQVVGNTIVTPRPVAGMVIPKINVVSDIKIKTSDELYLAFENQLTAIFNFKATIITECDNLLENTKNLVQAIIASREDMINVAQAQTIVEKVEEDGDEGIYIIDQSRLSQNDTSSSNNGNGGGSVPPELSNIMANLDHMEANKVNDLTPPPSATPAVVNERVEDLPSLSSLPSRPDGTTSTLAALQPKYIPKFLETDDEIENELERREKLPQVKEESSDLLNLSKEELETELATLKNKMKSVDNMREFVQRKFDGGKMPKAKFTKQVKNLENDKNKAKFRIEEIESRLSSV